MSGYLDYRMGGQPLYTGASPATVGLPALNTAAPQIDLWGGYNFPGAPGLQMPGTQPVANAATLNAMTPQADGGWMSSIGNWFKDSGFLGSRDQQGWGGLALGGAQALGGLYLGMQQYNLAKESLANSKAQFERNYAAQRTTTNAALEDRQRARVASNAGAYQSVGDYMAQNGVK
jgi:hypothetical protein